MAAVGDIYYTLLDWAKHLDPDGSRAQLVNIMAQTNQILDDMVPMQGNLPTGHRTTIVTALPSVTWRRIYKGIRPSKYSTVQVDEQCGMCEALAKSDEAIVRLNGGTAEARFHEDRPYIEAMNQEMAGGLFYFDSDIDEEKFMGFSARYPYKDAPNVVDGGGGGTDVTSVWVVVWGPETCYAIFPQGSKAGLETRDIGKGDPILTGDGDTPEGEFLAYVTHYKWDLGLCVKDWRYVGRYCNIETEIGAANSFDHAKLIELIEMIPDLGMGRPAIYANRQIKTQMDIAAVDSNNRMFQVMNDWAGHPTTHFFGIPVRRVDQLLNTETALTATP